MSFLASPAFLFDLLKMAGFIGCAFLALNVYARHIKSGWAVRLTDSRFALLTLLTAAVVGIKVFEDVVTQDSGPIDAALLWFVRQIMPGALFNFFSLVTLTGAAKFLAPATALLTVLFYVTRHKNQAILLAASMACGWALTYAVKATVNRARPELWSTTWYWGSSFPSGHTLSTAAFSTALVIGVAQIWPKSRFMTLPLAIVWTGLMALSRLVLGVHWPTDVLTAICLGVFIPLAISMLVFKDDRQSVLTTTGVTQKLDTLSK